MNVFYDRMGFHITVACHWSPNYARECIQGFCPYGRAGLHASNALPCIHVVGQPVTCIRYGIPKLSYLLLVK